MKHVSIVGKFFLLVAIFGLRALGLTFYQSGQMFEISRSYEVLLEKDASAAMNLSQSNRSLEVARASISDMMMTRSKEARARAATVHDMSVMALGGAVMALITVSSFGFFASVLAC